jgi:hypothetical protein
MSDLLNLPKNSLLELSAAVIVINILFTFVITLIIGWTYQRTHRGISYSKSFPISMAIMAVLATIAMMILSNNIVRALGVLGIFSLIRFRTILKDPKDMAYLFFALAMGMAVGTNNYVIAAIGTPVVSSMLLFLEKYNFWSKKDGFLMVLVTDSKYDFKEGENIIVKYSRSHKFLQAKTQPDGDQEYYFSLLFGNDVDFSEFVGQLKNSTGVKTVELISGKDTAEY